jgi:hypothetical protein
MKQKFYFILLAAALLLNSNVMAQSDTEAQTLFKRDGAGGPPALGYFVAPMYGITSMDGSTASLFHLRGGLNIRDKISLGGYFSTSLNEINPQTETLPNVYMDYWSLGGFVEYTLMAKKVFHLTFPVFLGFGEVQMDNELGEAGLGEANFLQVEPSALLEVNLHEHLRFNLGAGYRLVGQMEYRNFDQSAISGATAYLGLKFGLFR